VSKCVGAIQLIEQQRWPVPVRPTVSNVHRQVCKMSDWNSKLMLRKLQRIPRATFNAASCIYTTSSALWIGMLYRWCTGLTSHQTHYRSYWGRVFMGHMTKPTVSKNWRKIGSKDQASIPSGPPHHAHNNTITMQYKKTHKIHTDKLE